MNDPADDFLEQPPSAPVDAACKDALFRQTAALLPRARRPLWPIAAAAACIALALGAGWYVFRAPAPEPNRDLVERKADPPLEAPKPELSPKTKALDARDLEWSAFDAEDDRRRAQLYFQAGDVYLTAHDDIESALRCYRQALQYSEPDDLDFNPSDNWLVMALKRDRRKEP